MPDVADRPLRVLVVDDEPLLTAPGGDYAVRLKDGTRLRVSRALRDALAARLGLDRYG
jgi:hypothetical protein